MRLSRADGSSGHLRNTHCTCSTKQDPGPAVIVLTVFPGPGGLGTAAPCAFCLAGRPARDGTGGMPARPAPSKGLRPVNASGGPGPGRTTRGRLARGPLKLAWLGQLQKLARQVVRRTRVGAALSDLFHSTPERRWPLRRQSAQAAGRSRRALLSGAQWPLEGHRATRRRGYFADAVVRLTSESRKYRGG